ncbi:MAG: peptide chain release factor N(5)-glutamine methyltransferase [Desulfatiglandaceae bacterium]
MPSKTWCIKELLQVTTTYLKGKHIEAPRLNAEVLLAHQLDLDRVALYLNFDQPLTEAELSGYRSLVKRRAAREPLQYITGVQEFWSLKMTVGPDVLIPRPETEILVEQAVSLAREMEKEKGDPLVILELGTGCGAVAVALARELPGVFIRATDVSQGALNVARRNAVLHEVSDRIVFRKGDLWEPLATEHLRFDLVASNPPYVADTEMADLPPEVRDHEPGQALDGGHEGMHFLERIINRAPGFLNPGGWLVLEMAPHQTEKVLDLIHRSKAYGPQSRLKDYSGRYRVIKARKA